VEHTAVGEDDGAYPEHAMVNAFTISPAPSSCFKRTAVLQKRKTSVEVMLGHHSHLSMRRKSHMTVPAAAAVPERVAATLVIPTAAVFATAAVAEAGLASSVPGEAVSATAVPPEALAAVSTQDGDVEMMAALDARRRGRGGTPSRVASERLQPPRWTATTVPPLLGPARTDAEEPWPSGRRPTWAPTVAIPAASALRAGEASVARRAAGCRDATASAAEVIEDGLFQAAGEATAVLFIREQAEKERAATAILDATEHASLDPAGSEPTAAEQDDAKSGPAGPATSVCAAATSSNTDITTVVTGPACTAAAVPETAAHAEAQPAGSKPTACRKHEAAPDVLGPAAPLAVAAAAASTAAAIPGKLVPTSVISSRAGTVADDGAAAMPAQFIPSSVVAASAGSDAAVPSADHIARAKRTASEPAACRAGNTEPDAVGPVAASSDEAAASATVPVMADSSPAGPAEEAEVEWRMEARAASDAALAVAQENEIKTQRHVMAAVARAHTSGAIAAREGAARAQGTAAISRERLAGINLLLSKAMLGARGTPI